MIDRGKATSRDRADTPRGGVLVVDDDPGVRESTGELIAGEGYRVRVAGGGAEALDLMRAEPPPCLVLLDFRMPGMSGIDVLRRMSAEPSLAGTPVALLSAYHEATSAAGVTAIVRFLPKPYDVDELLELVRTYCDTNGEGDPR